MKKDCENFMEKVALKKRNSTDNKFGLNYFDCLKVNCLSKKTILLVEDEEEIRKVICSALKRIGCEIEQVSDAEQALDLINKFKSRFDLLITDITLPGINGYDLASNLLKIDPGMQFLFISGYHLKKMKSLFKREKAEFLEKPFSVEQLFEKIKVLLDYSI